MISSTCISLYRVMLSAYASVYRSETPNIGQAPLSRPSIEGSNQVCLRR